MKYDGSRFERWFANFIVNFSRSYKTARRERRESSKMVTMLQAEADSANECLDRVRENLGRALSENRELSEKNYRLNLDNEKLYTGCQSLADRVKGLAGDLAVCQARREASEEIAAKYRHEKELLDGLVSQLKVQMRDRRRLDEYFLELRYGGKPYLVAGNDGLVFFQSKGAIKELLDVGGRVRGLDLSKHIDLTNRKKQKITLDNRNYNCFPTPLGDSGCFFVLIKKPLFGKVNKTPKKLSAKEGDDILMKTREVSEQCKREVDERVARNQEKST